MSEDDAALSAGTLIDGARMYAASADAVNERYPNSLHVLSHLLGMSIELALKAYLRHMGSTEAQLRALGHDLKRLFDAATAAGMRHTGSRDFALSVLGHNYRMRLFAYPEAGAMNVIAPWRLRQMAHELVTWSFAQIKGSDVLKAMADQPGLCIQSKYPDDVDASGWAAPRGSN